MTTPPISQVCRLVLALSVSSAVAVADSPQPVSPGSPVAPVRLADSCPTFSWSGTEEANGHELVVYHVEEDGSLSTALHNKVPGDARGWTPPAADCPVPGSSYAWAVRALTDDGPGSWSELLLFETAGMPSDDEVRQALEVLQRYRDGLEGGVGDDLAPSRRADERPMRSAQIRQGASPSPTPSHPGRAQDPPLRTSTIGAGPTPQVITPPASFSLNLAGDINLAGSVFREGLPFVHSDADRTRRNSAVGINALTKVSPIPGYEDTTGINNTAFGYQALRENTIARHNTAVGANALGETVGGSFNTAVGSEALAMNTGGGANTAIGWSALASNQDGSSNVAVGSEALSSNYDGIWNVAVGTWAMRDNVNGEQNVAVGLQALETNTSGQHNTALGTGAMYSNLDGSLNTAVGTGAGFAWETGDDNIAIGRGAYGTASESGVIRIGSNTFQDKTIIAGIANGVGTFNDHDVCIENSGHLGPCGSSSARFKTDVRPMAPVEGLAELQPVSFRYREEYADEKEPVLRYGLIAEQVAEIFPSLVGRDPEGRPSTVRYDMLTPLLLAEIQSQREMIQGQQSDLKRLRSLDSEVAALRLQLAKLSKGKRFR